MTRRHITLIDDLQISLTPDSAQARAVRSAEPQRTAEPDLGRYAVAVGAVAAAIALTRFTWPLLAPAPFVLLFAAIFVGARWTTESASLLSIGLAAMGATVIAPAGDVQTLEPWMIVMFVGVSLAANRIVVGRKRAEQALRVSQEDLQIAKNQTDALNQQLERRVQGRTAELHESTERLRTEINQREQMEEELLRVRKLESLGVLAGGIAHDFNNFLTVVQVNVELAKQRIDPEAPVQVILEQTAKACQSAVFLSSQLLTFARGGAPIRCLISMTTLIIDAVHLARAGAAVTISVDIPDDLWSAEVDVGQIGQVFHNILLNAKQAMPSGGIIDVRAENVVFGGDDEHLSGAHVRISISDYGSGISSDILPRIFDPYFTTKPSGSGLGLATAYAIVAKHGGRLSVESRLGMGTVFAVDLPAASTISDRQASQVHPAPASHRGPLLSGSTARLLVMDDQETLRCLLTNVLTTLGYEVVSARDGAEAIDLYEAATASGRGFDAVMLDLTVSGGMGGVEAAQTLKELDPSVRLIASSGYSDAPVMAQFRDYGFADVLPKPWTLVQLSEVCRRVLAVDRQHKSKERP
jgi:signal transduction histidine kinase/CheY-like chemotaxis protein